MTHRFEYGGEGARIADRGNLRALVPGGPAEQAGLQPGDVITSFDGRPVSGPEELIVAIRSRQPGETVEIGYDRGGGEATVTVTLGAAGG